MSFYWVLILVINTTTSVLSSHTLFSNKELCEMGQRVITVERNKMVAQQENMVYKDHNSWCIKLELGERT